jgi:hypothetical protein
MNHTTTAPAATVSGLKTQVMLLSADQLIIFFPILQKGVTVPATVGCTLRSLLCDQLAIPADYVTDRITTIFLDNRPVDDLDRTIIRNSARVTLSAAMPGLVGATMRRGGFYAAFRQGISSQVMECGAPADDTGTIRLKLFNLLLAELGPSVLAHGIILEQDECAELQHCLPEELKDTLDCSGRTFLLATVSGVHDEHNR